MFNNIGKKIKGLAKAYFIIVTALFVIMAIATMVASVLAGLLVLIVGTLVAWISCWGLYGFGEIVDKLDSIENKLSKDTEEKAE